MKQQASQVNRDKRRVHNPVVERNGHATHLESSEDKLRARIAQRAYELYVKRGQREGHDLEDWLEAERQIRG